MKGNSIIVTQNLLIIYIFLNTAFSKMKISNKTIDFFNLQDLICMYMCMYVPMY